MDNRNNRLKTIKDSEMKFGFQTLKHLTIKLRFWRSMKYQAQGDIGENVGLGWTKQPTQIQLSTGNFRMIGTEKSSCMLVSDLRECVSKGWFTRNNAWKFSMWGLKQWARITQSSTPEQTKVLPLIQISVFVLNQYWIANTYYGSKEYYNDQWNEYPLI
jgi:hypothetical protein